MRTLRFRLTGSTAAFDSMMTTLAGMEHVDRIEEVGDLMSGMRDDSSSANLSDDDTGDMHAVEVHASSDVSLEHVRDIVEERAMELGVALEVVEEF
jgi:hypothetical protein